MDTKPLLMRIGLSEQRTGDLLQPDVTMLEHLPFMVEVHTGVQIQAGTRLTKVARETTDDN